MVKKRKTGLFVYVGSIGDFTWRVGYCSEQACRGHASKDLAAQHYREWLLDHVNYDGENQYQSKCEVCDIHTSMYAFIEPKGWEFVLCEEHRIRKQVDLLIGNINNLCG